LIALWNRVQGADLLVAGTGNYEGELRRTAAGKFNIKFLGALSQKQLGNLYYHAVACILPSITYETFGMIIIEAFARKTPVIVRDLGALPEVVEDSGGGFIYRTDEELLATIERFTQSPALRGELGEKGYRAFVENWSTEAHLKLYFDFLQKIAVRKFGYVPWDSDEPKPAANG
jgi:glycosyltransferase involved in cell wall biosynthesis